MPRPRPLYVTTLIALFVAMILSACVGVKAPLLPGDFDCEEMQGESLRAMLGIYATSREDLAAAIRNLFPDAEPNITVYPAEILNQTIPTVNMAGWWTGPRRNYNANIEDGIIESVSVAVDGSYIGPTVQDLINCLGSPQDYYGRSLSSPDGPQSGVDLRFLYYDQAMEVMVMEWNTEMNEDGQLANPGSVERMHVYGFTYLDLETREEIIDRLFWLRPRDIAVFERTP